MPRDQVVHFGCDGSSPPLWIAGGVGFAESLSASCFSSRGSLAHFSCFRPFFEGRVTLRAARAPTDRHYRTAFLLTASIPVPARENKQQQDSTPRRRRRSRSILLVILYGNKFVYR